MREKLSFQRDDRGSLAVITALAMLPIVALIGTAVDYARATQERAEMQAVIDGALLVGISQTSGHADAAKKAYEARRGTGDATSFWLDTAGVLRGTASASVGTAVMKIAGVSQMAVGVKGAASTGAGQQGNVCLLLLAPTGTGLTMNSSSTIDMPNCEVHVLSAATQGAVMINSSSSLITKRLCVSGKITLNSSQSRQSYQEGCAPVGDPFNGKLPVPPSGAACTYSGVSLHANSNPSIEPGVICGDMNFNGSGTITFKPGLHRVRNGKINIGNNDVIAEGVTFYFEDANSAIQLNPSAKMKLTPPTSGTYSGISMFEPPGITTYNSMPINAAATMETTGLYYLPSRHVTLNSSSSVNARKLTMVARTAMVNSSSTWKVDIADNASRRINLATTVPSLVE